MFFIFDWDGTLCDSTATIVRCMRQAAERVGLVPLKDDEILNIIGLGLPEAISVLYPDNTERQSLALKEAYSERFLADNQNAPLLFEGVKETLQHLRDSGFKLAIATGKSRRGLDRVLKQMGLAGFFHGSRCADETASKPHPKMLHELLQEHACPAEAAVMVGDTEYDMVMAKDAGMPRVAVSYGAHHVERLKLHDPILCVDYFPDILRVLC